jgi:hypothetical protein
MAASASRRRSPRLAAPALHRRLSEPAAQIERSARALRAGLSPARMKNAIRPAAEIRFSSLDGRRRAPSRSPTVQAPRLRA